MPDQVLTRDGPVAVPLDYPVPASGELIPKTVRATLDGSAVASEFFAAVQVIAPSGRVMFSAVSEAIAAGASADVSWFPRVGGAAGSSPPISAGGLNLLYDKRLGADAAGIDTGANGIAQTSKDLLVFCSARSAAVGGLQNGALTLNGDATNVYDRYSATGTGATVARGSLYSAASFTVTIPGDGADSGVFGGAVFALPDYTAAQVHNLVTLTGYIAVGNDNNAIVQIAALRYQPSAAITRMAIFGVGGNLRTGSRLTIYGTG